MVTVSTRTTNQERKRDYRLFREYAITLDEYEKILKAQNGVCWICHKPPVNKRLAVDHLHTPGEKKQNVRKIREKVRGLLCWSCNNAIAKLKDNSNAALRAADYLNRHPAQEILMNQDKIEPLLDLIVNRAIEETKNNPKLTRLEVRQLLVNKYHIALSIEGENE